jgi:hypothetical protein
MFYRVESGAIQKISKTQIGQNYKGPRPAWLPSGDDVPRHAMAGPSQQNNTTNTVEQPITVRIETEFSLMVKNTTTMTILTFLQLLSFLPYVILGMIYNRAV